MLAWQGLLMPSPWKQWGSGTPGGAGVASEHSQTWSLSGLPLDAQGVMVQA